VCVCVDGIDPGILNLGSLSASSSDFFTFGKRAVDLYWIGRLCVAWAHIKELNVPSMVGVKPYWSSLFPHH
jgi:hypothetical protein